jgi:hypothetical protein
MWVMGIIIVAFWIFAWLLDKFWAHVTKADGFFVWCGSQWRAATEQRRRKIKRTTGVILGSVAVLILAAMLYSIMFPTLPPLVIRLNPPVPYEPQEIGKPTPDGGRMVPWGGGVGYVPSEAVRAAERDEALAFYNRILDNLRRDTNEVLYEIQQRSGVTQSGPPGSTIFSADADKLIGGLVKNYVQTDFDQKFTVLGDALRAPNDIPSYITFRETMRAFLSAYNSLTGWLEAAAQHTKVSADNTEAWQRWNKTDAAFLTDYKNTTAKRTMEAFRGLIDDRPARLRDQSHR